MVKAKLPEPKLGDPRADNDPGWLRSRSNAMLAISRLVSIPRSVGTLCVAQLRAKWEPKYAAAQLSINMGLPHLESSDSSMVTERQYYPTFACNGFSRPPPGGTGKDIRRW